MERFDISNHSRIAIGERLNKIHSEIPEGVGLVAVSKFHPVEELEAAYNYGQRLFGESRVQELLKKQPLLPQDIKWHFIGHLQTNKVKQIIGKTALIESVDSEHLLWEIDRQSERAGVLTRVLMQVHIAREETKFGFYPDELKSLFQSKFYESLKATHISGIMGMASNTDNLERVKADFQDIRAVFDSIKNVISPDLNGFEIVSMGMSGDWKIAVEEGSNLIRIGTAIFGPREY